MLKQETLDLVGQRFNRLTILSLLRKPKPGCSSELKYK